MIFGIKTRPLLERFQTANEAESSTIKALLAYMQTGGANNETFQFLTDRLGDANYKRTLIWEELLRNRLDR